MSDATIPTDAPAPSQGAVPAGTFFERFSNPVLVKEIRQAQRGKVFAIALIVTLSLAMLSAVVMAIAIDASEMQRPGPQFFSAVYVFLCIAILVVVPFQGFVSMGAEWDDNTFEMLVLSNLSPRQIVFGKMLSSFTQGLLFLACFIPFMAVAFLLRGVDVATLLLILGLTAFACAWLTTVTTMLSTVVRKRFLRVLMMVLIAGALFGMVPAASGVAGVWMQEPDIIADPEFHIGLVQFLSASSVVGIVAFCIACNMLAHEEENRSTNLRVLTSVAVLLILAMLAFNIVSPRVSFPRGGIFGATIGAIFVLGFLSTFFGYEPERLGKRVEHTVPRSPLLATLAAPWFPGGGRGALFFLIHLGVLAVGSILLSALYEMKAAFPSRVPSSGGVLDDGAYSMASAALYAMLYVVLSMGVLYRFGTTTVRRNAVRAATLLTPAIYFFVPAIVGLFIGDRDLTQMEHMGNPGLLIGESWRSGRFEYPAFALLLMAAAALGVALNAPRMIEGLRQVRAASRDNRSAAVRAAAAREAA